MKITTVYTKGKKKINEDAIVVNKKLGAFAVIDGATGLGGLSGSLASEIVKENLEKNHSLPLLQRVLEGNRQLRLVVEEKVGVPLKEIPKYKRSSCGLAAIQIHKNSKGKAIAIDYVSAGDCMLFLQFNDNTIRQITYDHIERLDNMAITYMQKEWIQELKKIKDLDSIPEEKLIEKYQQLRRNIQELLQKNRNKLNTYEGYGIIDGDDDAGNYLEFGKIPLIFVKKILLLSDGLQLPSLSKVKSQETWLESAKIAFTSGIEELERYIIDLELSDPACIKYPRLSQSDDKSGILIEL